MMLVLLGLCWWKFMHRWHCLVRSPLTSVYTLTSIDNQQTTIKCHPRETRFQTIGGLSIVHYKELKSLQYLLLSITLLPYFWKWSYIIWCYNWNRVEDQGQHTLSHLFLLSNPNQDSPQNHKLQSTSPLTVILCVLFPRGLGTLLWTFLLIFILMYVGAIVGMEPWPCVLACFCVFFPCFFRIDPLVEE